MHDAIALPQELQQYAGRIVDADSHEMLPIQEWARHFGPEVQEFADAWKVHGLTAEDGDKNHLNVPDYPGDIAQISADVVNIKGSKAPGAVDIKQRLAVMDAMGVRRQLMYPTSLGFGFHLYPDHDPDFMPIIGKDREAKGKRWLDLWSDWAIGVARQTDRVRPVAPVFGDTVDELMARATRLIEGGMRAVWIPAGMLLGGKSPAHSDLDPFWKMLTDANCVATLHLGTEGQFFETKGWSDAAPFEGFRAQGEVKLDPWNMSVLHLPCQNFVSTMVLGGVFVRHPKLVLGIIEVAAFWIGPLMESLDMWNENFGLLGTAAYRLPERPSAYIKRHVRVTPFYFEPMDVYIERYGLEDVLCFSTDYPHVEGGKDMINRMYEKVARLGPDVVEKFFVTNASILVPD